MDKPVLIIEMPPLSDEAAAGAHHFLQELMIAFEAHYFHQLQRYYHKSSGNDDNR